MKWTLKEIMAVYHGAYAFEEIADGWLAAYQYARPQMDYFQSLGDFSYNRCMASNAKILDFYTTSNSFSLEYRIIWKGSEDSFEVAIDGLIADIRYVRDLEDTGCLAFPLPDGNKRVTFYLPADATVFIRNIETDAQIYPATPGTKVLWLGDSITQGYGPLRSGATYVSVVQRELGWDIVNQGIGGYVYDAESLMKMPGYTPEKIVVAFGTNQYKNKDMTSVCKFYRRLTEIYGEGIPVLCITPLWRDGAEEEQIMMREFSAQIKTIVSEYPQIHVVDGFALVPHRMEYFLDGLHPNALGSEVYGRNLVKAIGAIHF